VQLYFNKVLYLAPNEDADTSFEHYHWALGTLLTSLEAELSHHADAACAAALHAGRQGPTNLNDLLRAVWAIAVVDLVQH